jgi:hypothetical protein
LVFLLAFSQIEYICGIFCRWEWCGNDQVVLSAAYSALNHQCTWNWKRELQEMKLQKTVPRPRSQQKVGSSHEQMHQSGEKPFKDSKRMKDFNPCIVPNMASPVTGWGWIGGLFEDSDFSMPLLAL